MREAGDLQEVFAQLYMAQRQGYTEIVKMLPRAAQFVEGVLR